MSGHPQRIARALAQGRPLVLTHRDCLDGLACVGLAQRAFPDALWVGVAPDQVAVAIAWVDDALTALHEGAEPPGIPESIEVDPDSLDEESDAAAHLSPGLPATAARRPSQRVPQGRILVTDLSLQGDASEAISRLARIAQWADVVWLDHHAPQWPPEVEEAVAAHAVRCTVDRSGRECGATLTLAFLEALERRPVGAFRLRASPFTDEDRAAMRAVAHRDTFSDPDDVRGRRLGLAASRLRADFAALVRHGEYRALELLAAGPMRRRQQELGTALERVRRDGGVAWLHGGAPLSDLAHAYWPLHPDARLLVQFTRDGRMRVRSPPGQPLAQPLAQRFGGGGHAHAAGATLVAGGLRGRIYRVLGPRDPRVRKALRVARLLAGPGGASRPGIGSPVRS